MTQATAIEWTDLSWNPVHGCSKVSPGCAHCYAETLSLRYRQTLAPWTPANAAANVQLKPHKLREPLSGSKDWRGLGAAAAAAGKMDGKLVFVNSTSDLFHEQVPNEFIARVFAVMAVAHRHTFQVLTKRPERMRDLLTSEPFRMATANAVLDEFGRDIRVPSLAPWPIPNVWLGVSIENRRFVGRADVLRETPAAVRFISAEPLLGPLVANGGKLVDGAWIYQFPDGRGGQPMSLAGIDWLIVGGESGPVHRRIDAEWVRNLRNVACQSGTAFFFKQWGGSRPGGEALLDGRGWREFPQVVS